MKRLAVILLTLCIGIPVIAQFNKNETYILKEVKTESVNRIEVSISPNPASGSLNISFYGDMSGCNLALLDKNGEVVKNQIVFSNQLILNISDLHDKKYTLKIFSSKLNKSVSYSLIRI